MHYTPGQLPEIVKYLLECVDRYSNVYISRTLYSRKQRSRAYALPSRVIFLDDAPDSNLPYSAVVRTSAGRPQAYYRLETEQDADTIFELSRRGAYALHADKSGTDVEQMVRIPESFNTKRGERYAVRLAHLNNRTYTVEQLRAQWPHVVSSEGPAATIEWREVERWLGNPEMIFNPDGIPWRFRNSEAQGRRLLEGKLTPLKKDGTYDPSVARAILVKSCMMHGYEDTIIAAIAIKQGNFGHTSAKDTDSIKDDIARLIGKYRREQPNIQPTPIGTYPSKAAQPLPQIEPPKNGRPPRLTDDQYYARLKKLAVGATGAVMENQTEAADAVGVSVPTVRRIEKRLQEAGRIRRITVRKKGGTYSYVVLYSAITTPLCVDISASETAPLARSPDTEKVQQHTGNQHSEGSIKEHTRLSAPPDEAEDAPAVAVRLADAARAAVESVAAAGRVSYKRFAATFSEYFPHIRLGDDRLQQIYSKTLEDRRRERTMDKEQVHLRAAMPSELRRWARSYAWKHTDAHKRGHAKQAYMWGAKAKLVEDEIARRQDAGDWPPERPRRRSRDIPHVAVFAPAPLLAYAEPEPADAADAIAPSGACVPPQQPVVSVQPVIEAPAVKWEYVDRLFVLGELAAIERHCAMYKANYQQVVAQLGGRA
jgi:DNA-binding Lrp family transcriptional regulator